MNDGQLIDAFLYRVADDIVGGFYLIFLGLTGRLNS